MTILENSLLGNVISRFDQLNGAILSALRHLDANELSVRDGTALVHARENMSVVIDILRDALRVRYDKYTQDADNA